MKILQIANYKPGTGGISGQVEIIKRCLDTEHIDNAIFSVKGGLWFRFKAFFQLLSIGKKYDVFHIHTCSYFGFISAIFGVVAGKILKKRIILTYHGGEGEQFFNKYTRLVRFVLLKTDINIALSGFIGNVFDNFNLPYIIIPNIHEFNAFNFKLRQELRPDFISIRTLSSLYNIDCILDAYKIFKQSFPKASLTIVGDGPLKEDLEKKTIEEEIDDVQFIGRVNNRDIYHYLNKADIMLSSPNIDNMPVSVLEGMNAGLLVISSNVGGVPYMIKDCENGLLFESNSAEALAQKMAFAMNNQKKALSMIKKANLSLEQYSWEKVKTKLLPLYYNN